MQRKLNLQKKKNYYLLIFFDGYSGTVITEN